MKKLHLLNLIGILSILPLFSQNLKGTVTENEKSEPIQNVNILIPKANTGTFTNTNGDFQIKIKKIKLQRNDTLVFTHLNYKSLKISYSEFLSKKGIVVLQKKTELLLEVSVKNKRQLNPRLKFKELNPLLIPVHDFGSIAIGKFIYVTGGETTKIYEGYREAVVEANMEYQEPTSTTIAKMLSENISNTIFKNFSNKMQIYDIANETWNINTDIELENRAYHNLNKIGNTIYISGGKKLSKRRTTEYLSNVIERFNMETNKVEIDYTNPHQAVNFSSTLHKGNLITIGGSTKQNTNGLVNYKSKNHLFDTKSGNWYNIDFEDLQGECNGVIIENKIYLLIFDKVHFILNSLDLSNNEYGNEIKIKHSNPITSITQKSNEIYFYSPGKVFVYNTTTKVLNQYFVNISVKNPNIHISNEKLFIVGGIVETEYSVDPSEKLFSIDLNEFLNTRIISYFESE